MIRIITDSVSGIPQHVAQADGIEVASLYVNRDGVEFEDATMDIDGFYKELSAMIDNIPTSSQPSQGVFLHLFEQAADAGDEVLGIFTSSKHSGTLNGALRVARSVAANHADFRFCIIDSLSNSFDEAFAVFAAAAGRSAGCDLAQCAELAMDSIACSRILFTPESLRFLKAGGRIGDAAALLGSLMKLCPVITVKDGDTSTMAKVRTHKKALDWIAQRFQGDVDAFGFKNAVVQYIGMPEEAKAWAQDVIEPICGTPVAIMPVSPVIGLHVGPAIGLSYECNEPLPDKLTPGFKVPVFTA